MPDQGPIPRVCPDRRHFCYVFYRYQRAWIALEGDFDTYFGTFSKKSRKNLRRRIKNLREASGGKNDVRCYRTIDEMAAFYPLAREVSEKTYQEKAVDAGLPDNDHFYARMMEMAGQRCCCGSILFVRDKPISFLYCEQENLRMIAKYGGFDPDYAKLSPGTAHLCHFLEKLFDLGDCRFFDFGPGKSEYKEFFATHCMPCADVLILEKNLRNWIIIGVHKTLALLTNVILRAVDFVRLRQCLRQKFRGR